MGCGRHEKSKTPTGRLFGKVKSAVDSGSQEKNNRGLMFSNKSPVWGFSFSLKLGETGNLSGILSLLKVLFLHPNNFQPVTTEGITTKTYFTVNED